MNTPEDLKYAESHEWLKLEGDTATIGITDHAQNELSDVVYVELPKVGSSVSAKSPIAVVESVKAASDIYAPVSGEIVAVNEALVADPALVNTQPFEGGWIFKIKVSQPEELSALKSAADYRSQISG